MVHPSARLLSLHAPLHPFAVPLRSACARRVGLARRGWTVGGEAGGEVEGCDGVDVVGCGRGGDWGQVGVGGRRRTRGLCPCGWHSIYIRLRLILGYRSRRRYTPSGHYSSSCFPSYTSSFPSLRRRRRHTHPHQRSCRT